MAARALVVQGKPLTEEQKEDQNGIYDVGGLMLIEMALLLLGVLTVSSTSVLSGLAAGRLRRGRERQCVERLAAVGRMALSNYLATSVICTTFFLPEYCRFLRRELCCQHQVRVR